jgi:hypothetical protein
MKIIQYWGDEKSDGNYWHFRYTIGDEMFYNGISKCRMETCAYDYEIIGKI